MKDCCGDHKHPDHKAEGPRLNRVAGQIEGIKTMIAERRYCPDIITQLRAVRSALKTIESSVLERHLGSCVKDIMQSSDTKAQKKQIDELVTMFKRFED